MFLLPWLIIAGGTLGLTASTPVTPIGKHAGKVKPSSYIVKLRPGAAKLAHLAALSKQFKSSVVYTYDRVFDGYAIVLNAKALDYVRRSSEVEAIDEDGIVQLDAEIAAQDIHPMLAPSNITDSIAHKRIEGSSVDIYELDTGIYLQHSEFSGRAVWGATFGGYASSDGSGHGTYLAGIAIGATYGIAKQAKICAVKVLSDSGSGTTSDIIAGINWVIATANSTGRPAVILTAFGGSVSTPLDNAAQSAINNGIHFLAAAGSAGTGTPTSPRAANAIVVGAVDSTGSRAPWSNYGQGVSIYYYGVNIKSAWIGSTTATNTISGTSPAVAGVAGILAKVIDSHGNNSPAGLKIDLVNHARAGAAPSPVPIAQPW